MPRAQGQFKSLQLPFCTFISSHLLETQFWLKRLPDSTEWGDIVGNIPHSCLGVLRFIILFVLPFLNITIFTKYKHIYFNVFFLHYCFI